MSFTIVFSPCLGLPAQHPMRSTFRHLPPLRLGVQCKPPSPFLRMVVVQFKLHSSSSSTVDWSADMQFIIFPLPLSAFPLPPHFLCTLFSLAHSCDDESSPLEPSPLQSLYWTWQPTEFRQEDTSTSCVWWFQKAPVEIPFSPPQLSLLSLPFSRQQLCDGTLTLETIHDFSDVLSGIFAEPWTEVATPTAATMVTPRRPCLTRQ